jgi:membrane fusion protein, RTX toxin transport system
MIRKHLDAILQAVKLQKKEDKPVKKKEDELDFLPAYLEIMERPPSNVGRLFVLSIMLFCLIVLTWAIFGRLDIIASSPGQLIISERSKTIQAPENAEVTEILVRYGQLVNKGDVLIKMNPIRADAERKRLVTHITSSLLEEARLKALLIDVPEENFVPPPSATQILVTEAREYLVSEMSEQRSKLQTFESQLRENNAKLLAINKKIKGTKSLLNNVKKRYKLMHKLAEKGNYSQLKLLELENEMFEQQREYDEQLNSPKQLQGESETITAQMQQQNAEWKRSILTRIVEQRYARIDFQQELVKAQETSRLQNIVAPVDGVIQELTVHTLGGVVTSGQDLMVIVPLDAELVVDIKVLNKDKGFVLSGQKVEVKVDSFPYTKYGTIKGEVVHVSFDSVEDEELGLVFPAKIKLAQTYLVVEGKQVDFTSGMRVTAEIKIGDRRIIEYILSPLQEYASESLKEK